MTRFDGTLLDSALLGFHQLNFEAVGLEHRQRRHDLADLVAAPIHRRINRKIALRKPLHGGDRRLQRTRDAAASGDVIRDDS
jgi:hypothetical protein